MSSEITSYLQMIIGIAGIVVTLVHVRSLVPEIELFRKRGHAPAGLNNFTGFARILIVTTLLIMMLFLFGMGCVAALATAYMEFGVENALLASILTIASLVSLSVTATISLYGHRSWIAALIVAFALIFYTVVAIMDADRSMMSVTLIAFAALFVLILLGWAIYHFEKRH